MITILESNYENFAMGDMAGKISYLLDKKLIQLKDWLEEKNTHKYQKSERSL